MSEKTFKEFLTDPSTILKGGQLTFPIRVDIIQHGGWEGLMAHVECCVVEHGIMLQDLDFQIEPQYIKDGEIVVTVICSDPDDFLEEARECHQGEPWIEQYLEQGLAEAIRAFREDMSQYSYKEPPKLSKWVYDPETPKPFCQPAMCPSWFVQVDYGTRKEIFQAHMTDDDGMTCGVSGRVAQDDIEAHEEKHPALKDFSDGVIFENSP